MGNFNIKFNHWCFRPQPKIASFSPRLVVGNDAKGGVKEVRKFLIFQVKEAKQEAGSVVTKLENRFPNLRTRISPGCLSGKTTFCNKVSYSIVCKNCISFFSAGIGPSTWGSIPHWPCSSTRQTTGCSVTVEIVNNTSWRVEWFSLRQLNKVSRTLRMAGRLKSGISSGLITWCINAVN